MSSEKKKTTVELAEELILPITDELGLEVWDVRFEKEGTQWYLRYFLDKEGGINIQDCENASRLVSELLDKTDPIKQNYILEIGSPGIDRFLKKDAHFTAYMGEDIEVRFIRPVEGRRDYVGTLLSKDGQKITMAIDEETEMTFELKEAAFVRLYIDFESGGL